jgi:DNA-binding SARP family transcriptional activator
LVIASRLAQRKASTGEGLELAERAWQIEPGSSFVLMNLVAARGLAGDVAGALQASGLLEKTKSELSTIGRAYRLGVEASNSGSLKTAVDALDRAVAAHRRAGHPHFLGVALCNRAQILLAMGEARPALACAEEAIALLANTTAGVELISSQLARAYALAQLGELNEARLEIDRASRLAASGQAAEVAVEAAEIELFFGDPEAAGAHLLRASSRIQEDPNERDKASITSSVLQAHAGDLTGAAVTIAKVPGSVLRLTPAVELKRMLALALIACLRDDPDAPELARAARQHAQRQESSLWERYAALLEAVPGDPMSLSTLIVQAAKEDPKVVTMASEVLVPRLAAISSAAVAALESEAKRSRWRWLIPARAGVTSGQVVARLAAARLLELIGEADDVARLRAAARSIRDRRAAELGRALSRRLAPQVLVEDLGRLRIQIGERVVEGASVRRKVLALMCFLLTKPQYSCSREEALDALWPAQDPDSAVNSLNQTVYFLRRVFEPDYREDLSPGYVHQDGETLWLDDELIDSRSRRCAVLVRESMGVPSPDLAVRLANEYQGRFALDFSYDDWAGPFRDSLHAGFLRTIEQAIRADVDAGQWERGTFLAERASDVDPDSEEIQLALVRLYRYSGAHAAAAEAYAHYSRTMRDLGVDPAPFSEA